MSFSVSAQDLGNMTHVLGQNAVSSRPYSKATEKLTLVSRGAFPDHGIEVLFKCHRRQDIAHDKKYLQEVYKWCVTGFHMLKKKDVETEKG